MTSELKTIEFNRDELLDNVYIYAVHMQNTLDQFIRSDITEGELVQEFDDSLNVVIDLSDCEDEDYELDEIYVYATHMRNTMDQYIRGELTEGELVQELDESLDVVIDFSGYEDEDYEDDEE